MNSNSVANEIEKQTGLKRSSKTKKYAQETGRGNIAYAMRFAGYRYSGDFHVVKDYGNTFEVITDSPEGESKLNEILQVLNNLGLEIVTQGRTHIGFKIPLDENKWYGTDGSYRKGKWQLYKNYGRDGEYKLYNSEDENFVHNIIAYTPSQAKYSADYFIEQFEKGEIMNSRKPIKSGIYDEIIAESEDGDYYIAKDNHTRDYYLVWNGTVDRAVSFDSPYRDSVLKDWKKLYTMHEFNIKSSRKPIKSSRADLHMDNMEDVRERLEQAVTQSSVETLYDGEDCFITVTQKNYETGNESEWSFVVDFGTNKVQMLEPVEDEEGFTSDNEVYRIIKNFLNGGMSREKRMNKPDYDSGEPIKVTGKGNKIGNSRQSSMPRYDNEGKIWSDSLDEYVWEKVRYKDGDTYHWDDVNLLYWNDNGDESDYLMITTEEGLPKNCTPIKNSRESIKSAKTLCKKGSAKLIEHCEAGEYGYLGRYTIIINGEEVFNFTAENRREAVCSFNNYLDYKMNNNITNSRKAIKSSLSDVNKALGFTDNDVEEDGKIHITTDFGEFVVDYVNDEYIVTYDGEERTFTEYKDTVKEVVDLFNQLCNEEIKLFNENINSSKSIKSSKSVCIGFNTENGTLLWKRDDLYTLDGSSIRQTKQKDIADRWIEKYNLNTTDTKRLDKYTQEGIGLIPWGLPLVEDKNGRNYNKELSEILPKHGIKSGYVIEVTETDNDNTFAPTYVNGNSWQSENPQIFETREDAEEMADDFRKYLNRQLHDSHGRWQYKIRVIESSCRSVKSIKSNIELTNKDITEGMRVTWGGNSKGKVITWNNNDILIQNLSGKQDYIIGHNYTLEGNAKEPKLSWGHGDYGYLDKEEALKAFKKIKSSKVITSSKLPTEKDYQKVVDELNAYVQKKLDGDMYHFEMRKEDGMNNDGWGNEYPNFVIYDNEGNLDMFSDDNITQYLNFTLRQRGWYPEAVHSSSDFTIAII